MWLRRKKVTNRSVILRSTDRLKATIEALRAVLQGRAKELAPRVGGVLPLFTSSREGVFPETGLPVYGVLGNPQSPGPIDPGP